MTARSERLTRLETLLFDEAFRRYQSFGIPETREIFVSARFQDDAGRRTYVSCLRQAKIDDAVIVLGQVQLGKTGLLLIAELHVIDHFIRQLEFTVVGERTWSGDEPEPMVLFAE